MNNKLKQYATSGLLPPLAGMLLALGILYFIDPLGWFDDNNTQMQHAQTQQQPYGMTMLQNSKKNQITNIAPRSDSFCALNTLPNNSCLGGKALCETDMEIARIAWKYFENNYKTKTGLYNAADRYPSTTMWDTGSALAATIAALDFGFITEKEFDTRVMALLKTLNTMELFNKEAPNKVYNTESGGMVDYVNKPSPDGIGVSTLDLARIVSWLNILSCMHPKYAYQAQRAVERWDFTRLINKGQMYGLARDPVSKKVRVLQEGRLGYEQYAGKIFRNMGFDQHVSSVYKNKFYAETDIFGIPIAYDTRDPRDLGAYNYVVTESYAMDAIENGLDEENTPLLDNILRVQEERYKQTGIITAVSEDNIDQKPYFLYNTIFTAGLPWNTTTDKGVRYDHLKTTSVKASLSLAVLYPEHPYSKQLFYAVRHAYDENRGWYSGVYESGIGYNKARTANTNGIIMSTLLYKKYGEFYPLCNKCGKGMKLNVDKVIKTKGCTSCAIK